MNVLLRVVPIAALTSLAACETVQPLTPVSWCHRDNGHDKGEPKEIKEQASQEYAQLLAEAQQKHFKP